VSSEVPDSRFVMVGDGELRGEAERAVRAIGMSDRFSFPGWRPEIPDLMAAFDVFLLTSRWKACRRWCRRRLIAGCPVVATAVDGTREIVDSGWMACSLPRGTSKPSPAASRTSVGTASAGRGEEAERLVREFDQDGMVRAQERLYAEILAGKGYPGWS